MLIAQVTDTHLLRDQEAEMRGVKTWQTLKAVLEEVKQFKPDLLLLTGDIAHNGEAEAYQELLNLVQPLRIPSYWLPGNHDQPELMAQILNQRPIYPDKTLKIDQWQVILLDSFLSNPVYGEGMISPESLAWLESELQQCDRPALIALHHHPIPVGIDWLDEISVVNGSELIKVLDKYPQVCIVIFGHIHLEFSKKIGNINYYGAPATCIQVTPPDQVDDETTQNAIWRKPGFRLLQLNPDGSFQTEIRRI